MGECCGGGVSVPQPQREDVVRPSLLHDGAVTDRRLLKHVFDNVHGNITLDPLSLKFIDTEQFQRLWDLKQLEFINLLSSESNEVCAREDKRTIAPEHVLKALEVLGFGEYIEEVYAAYEQHKLDTLDSPKGSKFGGSAMEMTEEEAVAEQQRMFAEARARMNNGVSLQQQSDTDPILES